MDVKSNLPGASKRLDDGPTGGYPAPWTVAQPPPEQMGGPDNEAVARAHMGRDHARATAPAGPVEGGDLAALSAALDTLWPVLAEALDQGKTDAEELRTVMRAANVYRRSLAATPRPATGEAGGGEVDWVTRAAGPPEIDLDYQDTPTPSTADAPQGEDEAQPKVITDAVEATRAAGIPTLWWTAEGVIEPSMTAGEFRTHGDGRPVAFPDDAILLVGHGDYVPAIPPTPEVVTGREAEQLPVGSIVVREPSDRDRTEIARLTGGGPPLPSGCFPLTRTREGWREHYKDTRPDELAALWRFRVLYRGAADSPEPALAVGDEVTTAAELDRLPVGTVVLTPRGQAAQKREPIAKNVWELVGRSNAIVDGDPCLLPARILDLPGGTS